MVMRHKEDVGSGAKSWPGREGLLKAAQRLRIGRTSVWHI
jgi:hypothetical protein